MTETGSPLRESVVDLAVPLGDADEQGLDVPASLQADIDGASIIGLGEASHGTREFFEHRYRLIRYLVEEVGARAIGFEAEFDRFRRIDEVVAGDADGDVRALLADLDRYWVFRNETMVEFLEWLRSFNASRPPADRVHVYGFDMTIIECATPGIEPYLDRVDAPIEESLRDDLGIMAAGYGPEEGPEVLLESASRVHATLAPMVEEHEAAWVEATSRRAYERLRHRLHLIERQLEAHELDEYEDRLALRDRVMAENAERIVDRLGSAPLVVWGHNGHLNRGRHEMDEWDVDVPSMGQWLADGDQTYRPIAFGLGGGTVATIDADGDAVETTNVPEPPAGSIPDVLGEVDDSVLYLSVDALHDDPAVRDWLQSRPRRHRILGGSQEGEPVEYAESDLTEFDGLVFVPETSATRQFESGQE